MDSIIKCLDKGYVRLVDHMGSDLSVVNSARVSFDKQSHEFNEKDSRLIDFLAREGHTSPFRHATMQFEIYAPLMVARQHWKQVVGSDHTQDAWNESSRRYITESEEFYIPNDDEWRSAPADKKQGSGDLLDVQDGNYWTQELIEHVEEGVAKYNLALERGIAPEQARLFLPAYAMYVRYYWTASLQSVSLFLNQRLAHDAQKEIQIYAQAVNKFAKELFPVSIDKLTGGNE